MARYTGRDGRRHIAKPSWNRGKGTFRRKGEAQKAIDEAYGLSDRPDTLGDYFTTWTERHPRSERTNATNEHRISRVTGVAVEGIALKDWPMRELRRRHTLALIDHMLRVEGRVTTGAVGIIRSLSAKDSRGTKTDHGELDAGRVVPIPATLAWMLEAQLQVSDESELLFTTPTGRMWRERNFYRDLWRPTQEASGLDIRPHECRHSYVTHLRAPGVNDADLAEIAGHRVETMLARYTHSVGKSFEDVRKAII